MNGGPVNEASNELGVHSEVGKLRKVMVHRPELSLQRLTPSNHDELLFDDVLWVERAQYEHDQFVARMRERGVEVFVLRELLAREVEADLFVMVTDVDGVYADWGTPGQRRLDEVTPDELRETRFAAGSMGPKVDAAIRFVERTGKRAAIGGLHQIEQIVEGRAGTQVVPAVTPIGATGTEDP